MLSVAVFADYANWTVLISSGMEWDYVIYLEICYCLNGMRMDPHFRDARTHQPVSLYVLLSLGASPS